MKSFEWGCQFRNEIDCAREAFRLEINGIAIKNLGVTVFGNNYDNDSSWRCEFHKGRVGVVNTSVMQDS